MTMTRGIRFTRSEIQELLSTAKRVVRAASCDILIIPTKPGYSGRIVVVTPRRIGTAPQRNRVRRRLKALFQVHRFDHAGYDCAVIVKKSGVSLKSDMLFELLQTAFAKVGYVVKNTPAS